MTVKSKWNKVLLYATLLAMVFLTACAGASNGNGNGNGATTSNKQGNNNNAGKQSSDPVTITWMRYEHPIQIVNPNSVVVQESLKRQNVKLVMQSAPQSNYDEKKKTLIATNTIPDVILVNQDDISNFADTGIFVDLTDYLDQMPNFQKTMEDFPEINKNKIDGSLYGFPLTQRYSDSQSGQVPMLRVDLLEELSLPTPTSYEELYEVFKAFKAAYPNSFPFTSRAANGLTGTENLINPIAFGFGSGYTNVSGAKVYYDPHLDQYMFGPFMDEFKEAITYLNKLYREKLLDPDYTTATTQIWGEKLSSGKSLYYQDNTGFGAGFNGGLQELNEKHLFDMIGPLAGGAKGVKRELLYQLDHLAESYVISSKAKNKDAIIAYIDWLYSEEGIRLTSWGVEGLSYVMNGDKAERNPEFYDKYKNENDPNAIIKSELGTGYLGMALNADSTVDRLPEAEWKDKDSLAFEWTDKNYAKLEAGTAFRFAYDPSFTQEEREVLKKLRTQLDAYLAQTMDRFIMVDGAIENEWEKFLEQCKANGAEQLVEIYNKALDRSR